MESEASVRLYKAFSATSAARLSGLSLQLVKIPDCSKGVKQIL